MRIDVTTAHIERGRPADWCECSVSLAIREALQTRGIVPFFVGVGPRTIHIPLTEDSGVVRLPTPPLVAASLAACYHDHNRDGIGPFTFELDLTPLGFEEVA